jgi:hypothetical protein
MTRACLAGLILMLALPGAQAQTAVPEPILRMTIDPSRVVVGQSATLRLDVLVPNYMSAPPELPGFQVRNAVTRQLQSVNINDQQNGTSFAGVRFEFAIYPQEPGNYATTEQKLTIRYAAEPPAVREAVVALPRVEFSAFIPDAAVTLHPFLATNNLTLEQTVRRSSDQLKTGDSVTRSVTIRADGTPAMLLPPHSFAAIDGLALYPAQPSLADHTDGRTDALTATRVDSATYMLQRPGDYVLSAIDVNWWNISTQKIERAHLDAVSLQVQANPAQLASAPSAMSSRWDPDAVIDFIVDHWLITTLALIAFAALAWVAPRTIRKIAEELRGRREAYLQSEAWSFGQFRRAARHGNARTTYFALLDWLQRFAPVAPDHSLETLKAAAHDDALNSEILSIERKLFATGSTDDHCSPARLLRRVSAARRTLQRQRVRSETTRSLPHRLNPIGRIEPDQHGRRPAR